MNQQQIQNAVLNEINDMNHEDNEDEDEEDEMSEEEMGYNEEENKKIDIISGKVNQMIQNKIYNMKI